jgi:hypothetical protein
MVSYSTAYYDRFDNTQMDKDKWRWLEAFRDVSEGKLHLSVKSCDSSNVTAIPTAEAFSYMKANISVDSDSYISEEAYAHVRLKGEFYNDSRGPGSGQDYNNYEGEIRAEIFIFFEGGALKSQAQVWRFDEADPHGQHTTMFSENFTTSIQFDTDYELSIEFTGTSFVFKCNGETLSYPVSEPFYPSYTKLRVIDSSVNNYTGECGYIKAKIDNFYNEKDQTPYDTFDGNQLDANKWRYGEFIREIVDEKLRMKVERCNAKGVNSASPKATNESGYIEAKVAINNGSVSQGRVGIARIGSFFYNDKRGPGSGLNYNGYQDNVWASNSIVLDDTGKLSVYVVALRMDDPDISTGTWTTLFWEILNMPILLGQEYRLSIRFDGSKIIYKCNNETKIFDIQTPTFESYDKYFYLESDIRNENQQCGFIDATFDDIRIRPTLRSMSGVQLLLLNE